MEPWNILLKIFSLPGTLEPVLKYLWLKSFLNPAISCSILKSLNFISCALKGPQKSPAGIQLSSLFVNIFGAILRGILMSMK